MPELKLMRYLNGKLNMHYAPWNRWWAVYCQTMWSGRLVYLHFSKFTVCLDCRINWIEDMITGKPK